MSKKIIAHVGDRFGRLVLAAEVPEGVRTPSRYKYPCICDCGTKVDVLLSSLRSDNTTSCGCYGREQRAAAATKHGLRKHPLYTVWDDIKGRCFREKATGYIYYGGRGILMHRPWADDFKCFYDWCIENGWTKELELDRRENDGNYEPSNCRFVTHRQNSLNTRAQKSLSGYTGVHPDKNSWAARIIVKGTLFLLGNFPTKRDAVVARNTFIKSRGLENEYEIQTIKGI